MPCMYGVRATCPGSTGDTGTALMPPAFTRGGLAGRRPLQDMCVVRVCQRWCDNIPGTGKITHPWSWAAGTVTPA